MVEERKVKFTDDNITLHTRLTGDTNWIHSPIKMSGHQKKAIAPGMLTLTYALRTVQEELSDIVSEGGSFVIDASFGNLVSSGEALDFHAETDSDEIRLYAFNKNHANVLSSEMGVSKIQLNDEYYVDHPENSDCVLKVIEPKKFAIYNSIFGFDRESIGNLSLLISSSSSAILEGVAESEDLAAIAVREAMQNGKIPAYHNATFGVSSSGFSKSRADAEDIFNFEMDFVGEGRNYTSDISCEAGAGIYKASLDLKLMKDRLLLRMADDR